MENKGEEKTEDVNSSTHGSHPQTERERGQGSTHPTPQVAVQDRNEQEEQAMFEAQLRSVVMTFQKLVENPRFANTYLNPVQHVLPPAEGEIQLTASRKGKEKVGHPEVPMVPSPRQVQAPMPRVEQESTLQVGPQVLPPPSFHPGYFGGGSVFQSMTGYTPPVQGYMPGTVFQGMQNVMPNPMYANMGLQPGFQSFQSGYGIPQHTFGMAGHETQPMATVFPGPEDVSTKIITFTSQGPWDVCILSANGAISNATLRHAGVSGGAVTYEGRFEILSLTGSFLLTESNGTRSRTGGLSVSLAGPDGRVMGGGVAGLLMAASPVQVVVGTFYTENRKIGGGEATSGIKTPTMGSTGTQPFLPQMNMNGVERMHDHNMGEPTGGEEQSRAYHVQSLDWGGHQFDADTRDDTEHAASSPSEP
ncbi:hypothetical protein L7F22_012766 [Adiantum nelumboides]|nr:hypothetical protein [Adiantum nelumboides]